MRARKGFTFMELMISLMIILVMMAVAIPRMKGAFGRGELRSAAFELTSTLRYARNVAVLRSDGAQVVMDPKAGTYRLTLLELSPEGEPMGEVELDTLDEEEYKISAEVARRRRLPSSVFFSIIHTSAALTEYDSLPRVIFYPDGSATASSIGIQNVENKAFAIVVYRTTGLATVQPGKPQLPADVQPLFYLPELEPFEPIYVE